jgi:hypothetical protein
MSKLLISGILKPCPPVSFNVYERLNGSPTTTDFGAEALNVTEKALTAIINVAANAVNILFL